MIQQQKSRFKKDKPSDGFESKLLDLARVTRVSAGGRRLRFRAAIVAGDKAGKVGLGVAKGLDVAKAVEKATNLAKKNLVTIPIINETIACESCAKFGASRVLLKPQKKGKGLSSGGAVRTVCDLCGIKNISSKILGRTGNKINNAKATIKALEISKNLKISKDKRKTCN